VEIVIVYMTLPHGPYKPKWLMKEIGKNLQNGKMNIKGENYSSP
jgi:hypothetical protein